MKQLLVGLTALVALIACQSQSGSDTAPTAPGAAPPAAGSGSSSGTGATTPGGAAGLSGTDTGLIQNGSGSASASNPTTPNGAAPPAAAGSTSGNTALNAGNSGIPLPVFSPQASTATNVVAAPVSGNVTLSVNGLSKAIASFGVTIVNDPGNSTYYLTLSAGTFGLSPTSPNDLTASIEFDGTQAIQPGFDPSTLTAVKVKYQIGGIPPQSWSTTLTLPQAGPDPNNALALTSLTANHLTGSVTALAVNAGGSLPITLQFDVPFHNQSPFAGSGN